MEYRVYTVFDRFYQDSTSNSYQSMHKGLPKSFNHLPKKVNAWYDDNNTAEVAPWVEEVMGQKYTFYLYTHVQQSAIENYISWSSDKWYHYYLGAEYCPGVLVTPCTSLKAPTKENQYEWVMLPLALWTSSSTWKYGTYAYVQTNHYYNGFNSTNLLDVDYHKQISKDSLINHLTGAVRYSYNPNNGGVLISNSESFETLRLVSALLPNTRFDTYDRSPNGLK